MAAKKEILLYGGISDYSAEDFINQMEIAKECDITMRMNCNGGNVYSAMGMLAKWNEHTKGKTIQVDGQARSGGLYFCIAADNVECLDSSAFTFHRAAMPDWIESDKVLFEQYKPMLTDVNATLRKLTESKINAAVFAAVTGKTFDEVFSLDSKIDINFDAEKAKALGIVKKINPLTPAKKIEIETLAHTYTIAAFAGNKINFESQPIKKVFMNKIEFKAAHPDIYAEILKEGITAEHERIELWNTFKDVDPKAVSEGIASGNTITAKVQNELIMKAIGKKGLEELKSENPKPVATGETVMPTAEEKKALEFNANIETIMKNLKQ